MDGNNGDQEDLYFYTGSGAVTTAPTVTVSPLNGATSVPTNTQVLVSVSAPVDVTSWNQSSVQLLDPTNTPVPGIVNLTNPQTLTFIPTTSSITPAGTLLGCFNDTGNRVLNGFSFSSGGMTVEACVAACGSRGYAYAGAQDGNQCFCGSGSYSSAGSGNLCNMTCSGNSSETCGGNLANDVYTALPEAVPANLNPSATYTVDVSGFDDVNGNLVTPFSSTFTTGTAANPPGLSLTSTNVPYGATGVSPTQQLVLTFNQILDPTTVNSSTLEVMNGWNSNYGLAGTYVVSGSTVTFTPLTPFPNGANITVGECGGPTDILGDVFYQGACWQQELMNFTVTGTPDTTPPTVVSVNPTDGATNVRHDLSVSITFSKSINPGSAGGFNTELFAGQDLQDNGNVSWSVDHRTLTFNIGALYNGATYTIVLPAGGISDVSGNALANTFVSTFTTAVNPATGNGSVQTVSPYFNSTGVPTDSLLTLYMNRQVNPSTVPGNLTVAVNGAVWAGTVNTIAGGYELQYTPTTAFPAGAVVQWFLNGSVYDVYGDAFNGNSGTFYMQAAVNTATEQPVVVQVSPIYGSNQMPTNGQIDIEYNVPIDASSISGNVYFNGGGVTYNTTLPSPNVVRLTPTSALSPTTYYYICSNGSVMGTNGVAAQGDCYATYFETTAGPDNTSGTVSVGPPDSSVNVGTNAYIRLQFSKPVDATSINSSTVKITTGGVAIPGTWSYNTTGSNVVGANFSPVNPLPASSAIKVVVSGLIDYVGNAFGSAHSTFTTAPGPDFSAASVTMPFPYGQTGVGTNATFTCLYSKPMDPSSLIAGGVYIYSYGTNARVPVNYTVSSDMMSVTMTPTSALTPNTEFNDICDSAIDLTGNAQNNNNAIFYTGSGTTTTGPTLVTANPPNGTTGMAINTNNGPWAGTSLGLLFNEPVAGNSLGNITLTPQGGSPLPIAVYQEIGDTEVTVQLPSALLPSTTYTYSVSGVTDINGNLMTPATSTFTTGTSVNFTNPTVSSVLPANGATGISDTSPTISITFSAPMDPVLIDGGHIYLQTHNSPAVVATTFTISADYKTVTLTPTAALSAATIYDLVTESPNWYMTDFNGNPYYPQGIISTFTTQ